MSADAVNALFELGGSVMVWLNVIALYRDKQVRGVRAWPITFFTMWGCWNLYYYPHLAQWYSFFGGVSITLANIIWVAQLFYYSRPHPRSSCACADGVDPYCSRHGGA